jgi:hypothetical protein
MLLNMKKDERDKKPIDTPTESSSEFPAPEKVNFIEGDEIFPLPTFVTRHTLSDFFEIEPGDTLEMILRKPKK